MTENKPVAEGIACPACGAVEEYAGKKNIKKPDNSIYRTKECKCRHNKYLVFLFLVTCLVTGYFLLVTFGFCSCS
jgi:hypothetical protein